jgi:hypothetical protein
MDDESNPKSVQAKEQALLAYLDVGSEGGRREQKIEFFYVSGYPSLRTSCIYTLFMLPGRPSAGEVLHYDAKRF